MSDINITVTKEEIISLLERYINHPDSKELATLIGTWMTHDEKPAKQLYKAMTGIFPRHMYEPGDFVWVRVDFLSTWKFNKKLTKEKKLPNYETFDNNDYILCNIAEKYLYKSYDYEIAYTVVDDQNNVIEVTQSVDERAVFRKEESFFEFIDKIDTLDKSEDLPF